jgi:hypothetical protein
MYTFYGKHEVTRPRRRSARTWGDNIKMEQKEIVSRRDSAASGLGLVAVFCERGITISEFMKDREFHDQLRDCKFIAKVLATKNLSE